ncbi:hypothetical protein SprV_0802594000 [Sparganum proliferum]
MPPTPLSSPLTRTAAWRADWDKIQSKALAVLGRAPRHLQPALREGPPAKSLHRPPLRRRDQSSILPLRPPRTTTNGRTPPPPSKPSTVHPPNVLHLSSAPTEIPRSPRRHKFCNDRPNNSEASSIAPPPSPTPPSPACPMEDQHQPRPPILSLYETIKTVQQLSSEKAPASDAAPAEVYKHDGPQFMEHLTDLFEEMRRQEEVPQDFKDTTIIHLYKRIGNRQVCDNHRGICLLNIAGKIFAHILLNRLHNYLDQSVLAKSQCGLRRYRGTMDRIFATHQLQEKCQEMRAHLYFPFVDLTNAFDRVNCDEVWNIMR